MRVTMKIALLVTATLGLAEGRALAQEPCNGPIPSEAVQLYSELNHGGDCVRLRLTKRPITVFAFIGAFGWNDRVASAKTASDVRLRHFQHADFEGNFGWVHDSANWLGGISSVRIEPRWLNTDCRNIPAGFVAVWRDAHWQGDCMVFDANAGGTVNHLPAAGFPSRSISAIWNNSSKAAALGAFDDGGLLFWVLPGEFFGFVGGLWNDRANKVWVGL